MRKNSRNVASARGSGEAQPRQVHHHDLLRRARQRHPRRLHLLPEHSRRCLAGGAAAEEGIQFGESVTARPVRCGNIERLSVVAAETSGRHTARAPRSRGAIRSCARMCASAPSAPRMRRKPPYRSTLFAARHSTHRVPRERRLEFAARAQGGARPIGGRPARAQSASSCIPRRVRVRVFVAAHRRAAARRDASLRAAAARMRSERAAASWLLFTAALSAGEVRSARCSPNSSSNAVFAWLGAVGLAIMSVARAAISARLWLGTAIPFCSIAGERRRRGEPRRALRRVRAPRAAVGAADPACCSAGSGASSGEWRWSTRTCAAGPPRQRRRRRVAARLGGHAALCAGVELFAGQVLDAVLTLVIFVPSLLGLAPPSRRPALPAAIAPAGCWR